MLTSLFTATLGGPLVRAAAFSYGLNKAIKARRGGQGRRAQARPPLAVGSAPMKRLFWLGVGLAAGAYVDPPGRQAAARASPPQASAPTSPTGSASSARGSARSGPRCGPG